MGNSGNYLIDYQLQLRNRNQIVMQIEPKKKEVISIVM